MKITILLTLLLSATLSWSQANIADTGTSADQVEDPITFKIYPNPVKDRMFIESNSTARNLDITFYDVLGKAVKKGRLNDLNFRNGLDVSELKRGVYLVQIDNGNNIFTQKMVKG